MQHKFTAAQIKKRGKSAPPLDSILIKKRRSKWLRAKTVGQILFWFIVCICLLTVPAEGGITL
jgi:hypothetical protein